MEISLFDDNASIGIERCVLYPYPDLKRIWTRLWITPTQDDEKPNLEVIVLNPDGSENCSVYMMAHAEARAETTLHMRNPIPGATYQVAVEMTQGIGEAQKILDRHTFEMLLEFRNPETGEPGFGFGVDWDELARKTSRRG
ncbi:MAG: hypothetical protein BroJett021_25300 [Chloroflexota bacterium]|jgi:hypothetical protein|nr:hypothetical protein [Caldilinea sp.]GIK73542.1 MAG: hypothetical protein BroJett021_25300 [Chloroflexota bacterium]